MKVFEALRSQKKNQIKKSIWSIEPASFKKVTWEFPSKVQIKNAEKFIFIELWMLIKDAAARLLLGADTDKFSSNIHRPG